MGGAPQHRRDTAAAEPAGNRLVREGCRAGGARRRQSLDARLVDFWGPPVTLTAADVAEILRLVEESSFDELSLELDGIKLNFKRGATGGAQAEQLSAAAAPGAVAAANPPPAAAMAADPA